MTYVKGRRVIDADSHLMEWPGFLTDYAPAVIRADLPKIAGGSSGFETKTHQRTPEAHALELIRPRPSPGEGGGLPRRSLGEGGPQKRGTNRELTWTHSV